MLNYQAKITIIYMHLKTVVLFRTLAGPGMATMPYLPIFPDGPALTPMNCLKCQKPHLWAWSRDTQIYLKRDQQVSEILHDPTPGSVIQGTPIIQGTPRVTPECKARSSNSWTLLSVE